MYEKFEELLNLNNITAYKVSKDTGIPYSALSEWKAGRSTPKQDKLIKLAEYFGVSIDYLLGFERNVDFAIQFSTDEENRIYLEMMSNLEKMNIEGMKQANRYLAYLVGINENLKKDE
ncbi:MAG TPA: helix-turn-helix transcriptional regulator [Mobilitalea sp.]|nr:helix-turn-helix transcriptional regulator [Mobilitalea sp.]